MPCTNPVGPLIVGTRVDVHRVTACAVAVTVIAADAARLVSATEVAVIVAFPAATPRTTATPAPLVTATVAVSCAVWLIVIDAGAPLIVTDTTVGVVGAGVLQFGALTGHLLPLSPHDT